MCIQPVEIGGRRIARTFWGEAWCDHLESFSDYENRLPRGRAYVRNGSVCHLEIAKGELTAIVSGSRLYDVKITVKTLPKKKWVELKKRCGGQIGSLLELLQGRLSKNVMTVVTDRGEGLFPLPGEMKFTCSCPDWARMCKHVAAVLYGVGARLDAKPELLFLLRGVDHEELISAEAHVAAATMPGKGGRRRIADEALAEVFGIEMAAELPAAGMAAGPVAGKAARSERAPARVEHSAVGVLSLVSKTRPVTGKDVAKLRAKLDMSQSRFSKLLGVSVPTVSNWERASGTLHLQARTLTALGTVAGLTKQEAWQRLERL